MKIYSRFESVEKDIRGRAPAVLYKFRSWEEECHKRIITESEVWFAHPHTLNDQEDLRPPYNFIAANINWDIAREEFTLAGRACEPDLSEEELNNEVEKRLEDFKNNPVAYFKQNRTANLNDAANYDQIGVFSCCTTSESKEMWERYASNYCGFVIGFNTVELARTLNCAFGMVNYCDKPIDYHILGDNRQKEDEIFKKSTKWDYEKEFRFVTHGIGIINQRSQNYPAKAVEEIILGPMISEKSQTEILNFARKSLPNVPIYKIDIAGDNFVKKDIKE